MRLKFLKAPKAYMCVQHSIYCMYNTFKVQYSMGHPEHTWKNVSIRGCWDSSSPIAKLPRVISSLLILSQVVSSSTFAVCLLISFLQAGSLPSKASLSFGSSAAALFSSISSSSVLDIVPDMGNSTTAAKLSNSSHIAISLYSTHLGDM